MFDHKQIITLTIMLAGTAQIPVPLHGMKKNFPTLSIKIPKKTDKSSISRTPNPWDRTSLTESSFDTTDTDTPCTPDDVPRQFKPLDRMSTIKRFLKEYDNCLDDLETRLPPIADKHLKEVKDRHSANVGQKFGGYRFEGSTKIRSINDQISACKRLRTETTEGATRIVNEELLAERRTEPVLIIKTLWSKGFLQNFFTRSHELFWLITEHCLTSKRKSHIECPGQCFRCSRPLPPNHPLRVRRGEIEEVDWLVQELALPSKKQGPHEFSESDTLPPQNQSTILEQ